ncbi:hypothetical protein GUJ93_ZPchr0005g14841 [Zizania palustris]|uniref:Secreted protein n=1 Tax=Zizania palustris TaxID=103762 RepID=A0A8J5T9R0_ZIZPA|nr:hypothetical protein GUJ93_ZPchr0005g14841 [Zizania palustris]
MLGLVFPILLSLRSPSSAPPFPILSESASPTFTILSGTMLAALFARTPAALFPRTPARRHARSVLHKDASPLPR